jgi:hypothetical protein
MEIYKKWWFWAIFFIVAGLIWYLTSNSGFFGCSYQHDQIENELKSANFCGVDSDCKILPLGGIYVEFGCYHYVNKNIDGQKIYERMDGYWRRCSRIIDECMSAPEATCVNSKCVENKSIE